MMGAHPSFGFRVVGGLWGRRRLVDGALALAAYAGCHPRAEVGREGYLSAFWFGEDFRDHLRATGSSRGFGGACWAPFVWWDLDSPDDPGKALADARRLTATLLDRYRELDEDDLLVFFSGRKGYHAGLPTCWGPAPSAEFHRVARQFAENVAAVAGVVTDPGIYDKVRAFRAPNSRHPSTGLHKRRLTVEELMGLSAEGVRRLAREPVPFALPSPTKTCGLAAADWRDAETRVRWRAEAKARPPAVSADWTPRLNRQTLEFIRNGAEVGDRHRLLFSAAANLAELGCPPGLAHALLTEAALDSGLPPSEVRRQIECGLEHVNERKGEDADG
jgi:hypothetical protein